MSKPTYEEEQARLAALPRAQRFEELLDFPCEHTFKVIGAPQGLEARARALLSANGQGSPVITERPSKSGRWLSLSLTVQVTSGKELDRLYSALEGLEGMKCLF